MRERLQADMLRTDRATDGPLLSSGEGCILIIGDAGPVG